MKYNASHFNGTNYDHATKSEGVFRLADKSWANDVDKGKGNFDFLLCNNVELSHPDVKNDLKQWVQWLNGQLSIDGLRFDAVKHMSQKFTKEYVQHIRRTVGKNWLLIGEYMTQDDTKILVEYVKRMSGNMCLFDFPLLRNFIGISRHADADLRYILGNTLSERLPNNAVVRLKDNLVRNSTQAN